MKKIDFKLGILCIPLLMQGCATNDSNSPLVRFWNDGFVYSEKEAKVNNICSKRTNIIIEQIERNNKYNECMKNYGY